MSRHALPRFTHRVLLGVVAIALIAAVLLHGLFHTSAAQLGNRQLQLGTADAGTTADYLLSFDLVTSGTLGSVVAQFCSEDPFPGNACTGPPGLDVSNAVLADQTGPGGFAISGSSDDHTLVLTRSAANASAGPVSFHFTGVQNPSASGSYYVRVQTYASEDASGPASDYGGIAFAIVNPISITATVPPYLIFCTGITIPNFSCAEASGDYIDFGELSTTSARSGSSKMLAATNAVDGYNVTVDGTTLTSGNNVITALLGGDVSRPGTAQFGFNLRANAAPAGGSNPTGRGVGVPMAAYNQPNVYRFSPGDMIISSQAPDDIREYTASYIVNVPKGQSPGVYVSTLTYICLASF